KDSINDAVIQNKIDIVNPGKTGTKVAAHYRFTIEANNSRTIRLRLRKIENHHSPADSVVPLSRTHSSALTGASRPSLPAGEREKIGLSATRLFDDYDEIFAARKAEAKEFY